MDRNTVPQSKLSKKEKAMRCKNRRTTWEFSPVSRIRQSRKIYKRQKNKEGMEE